MGKLFSFSHSRARTHAQHSILKDASLMGGKYFTCSQKLVMVISFTSCFSVLSLIVDTFCEMRILSPFLNIVRELCQIFRVPHSKKRENILRESRNRDTTVTHKKVWLFFSTDDGKIMWGPFILAPSSWGDNDVSKKKEKFPTKCIHEKSHYYRFILRVSSDFNHAAICCILCEKLVIEPVMFLASFLI